MSHEQILVFAFRISNCGIEYTTVQRARQAARASIPPSKPIHGLLNQTISKWLMMSHYFMQLLESRHRIQDKLRGSEPLLNKYDTKVVPT
jgi:hypothetical protein